MASIYPCGTPLGHNYGAVRRSHASASTVCSEDLVVADVLRASSSLAAFNDITSDLKRKHRQELQMLQKRYQEKSRQLEELKNVFRECCDRINEEREKSQKVFKEYQSMKVVAEKKESLRASFDKEKKQYLKDIENYQRIACENQGKYDDAVRTYERTVTDLKRDIENERQNLRVESSRLRKLDAEMASMSSERDRALLECQSIANEVQYLKTQIEAIQRECNRKVDEAENKVKESERRRGEMEDDLQEIKEENRRLQTLLANNGLELQKSAAIQLELEEEISTLRTTQRELEGRFWDQAKTLQDSQVDHFQSLRRQHETNRILCHEHIQHIDLKGKIQDIRAELHRKPLTSLVPRSLPAAPSKIPLMPSVEGSSSPVACSSPSTEACESVPDLIQSGSQVVNMQPSDKVDQASQTLPISKDVTHFFRNVSEI